MRQFESQLTLGMGLLSFVGVLHAAIEQLDKPSYALAVAVGFALTTVLVLWQARKRRWVAWFPRLLSHAPKFLRRPLAVAVVFVSLYVICISELWPLARSAVCGSRVNLVAGIGPTGLGYTRNLCAAGAWPAMPLIAALILTFLLVTSTAICLAGGNWLGSWLSRRIAGLRSRQLVQVASRALLFLLSLGGVMTATGVALVRIGEKPRPRDGSAAVGVNLPWLNYGHDFGSVKGWRWQGVSQNEARVRTEFAALKAAGVDHVTWFLFGDGRASPEWDGRGHPTDLDPNFWRDYEPRRGTACGPVGCWRDALRTPQRYDQPPQAARA